MDYPVLAGCGLTRLDAAKVLPLFSWYAREDVNGPLIHYTVQYFWMPLSELPFNMSTELSDSICDIHLPSIPDLQGREMG